MTKQIVIKLYYSIYYRANGIEPAILIIPNSPVNKLPPAEIARLPKCKTLCPDITVEAELRLALVTAGGVIAVT